MRRVGGLLAAVGLALLVLRRHGNKRKRRGLHVCVVGAGLSGLAAAIKVKSKGFTCTIIEREATVGGTWAENTYPGCECDVPSSLYSLEAYPQPKKGWSKQYSDQAEILAYMKELVEVFNLGGNLHLETEVTEAAWNADSAKWSVTTRSRNGSSQTQEFDVLVNATGPLRAPKTGLPDISGIERFKGIQLHTAAWDHSVELEGKRVAVVGSASSAVQLIPPVAAIASAVTVYQRTPNWILKKPTSPVTPLWQRLQQLPFAIYPRLARLLLYIKGELIYHLLFSFRPGFLLRYYQGLLSASLKKHFKPIADKIIPAYEFGCKRIVLSSEYYPALCRDNVELVAKGVSEVTGTGLIDSEGVERECDVVVWATGFEVRGSVYSPYPCTGVAGTRLEDQVGVESKMYLGSMLPNFPNYFRLLGPNTAVGHTSVLLQLESQLEFLSSILDLLSTTASAVSPTQALVDKYTSGLAARHATMAWQGGCSSYYKNDATGLVDGIFPGSCSEFRRLCTAAIHLPFFDVTWLP